MDITTSSSLVPIQPRTSLTHVVQLHPSIVLPGPTMSNMSWLQAEEAQRHPAKEEAEGSAIMRSGLQMLQMLSPNTGGEGGDDALGSDVESRVGDELFSVNATTSCTPDGKPHFSPPVALTLRKRRLSASTSDSVTSTTSKLARG
ncbi:hypothetical protein PsorP6_011997 [Peronosclerospora sorghi]|uniref:Uncharacterized protein n=1 Tax=Peronosclerospora sorghi TaxID=230839 RepID=A0ACC0WIQ1_9STRA|nr:hypothetical protein PsorP6_011997 [Peronosclerospora sorghi]